MRKYCLVAEKRKDTFGNIHYEVRVCDYVPDNSRGARWRKTGYRIGSKTYNPDTSVLLCETPQGKLFKKKGSSFGFFLYNPDGETVAKKITPLTWADANNLTKTYAPRAVHLEYFSTLDKETDAHKGGNSVVRLDEYHRIKAQRNAEAHHMRMTEYIKYLIDRDDKNNNYCK